jgi:hypothetical protein
MPRIELTTACSALVAQLDNFRAKWLGIAVGLVEDALAEAAGPRLAVVNRDFDPKRGVGATEVDTPADFPFNTIDGETIEAAVVGFQSAVAVQFAMAQGYMVEDDFGGYAKAVLAATKENRSWVLSVMTLFGDTSISLETVAHVLARFLMSNDAFSQGVSIASGILEERGIPTLAYLSQLGTAVAFDDAATATSMMQRWKQAGLG